MARLKIVFPDGSEAIDIQKHSWGSFVESLSTKHTGWFRYFVNDELKDEAYFEDGKLCFGWMNDGNYSGEFVQWESFSREEIERMWKLRSFQ